MEAKDPQESRFDLATSRLLDNFAQRVSRRGILARMGKLALGALGISLLPNLPVDRTFVAEAFTGCLTDYRLCGIYGYLCQSGTSCCGGGTGSLTGCPSCTTKGTSFWSMCCESDDGCTRKMISYWDCCGGTDAQAAGCKGEECFRNTPQPAWCTSGTYRCTVISIGASC
jgi:methylamine dehydrogenase light chain